VRRIRRINASRTAERRDMALCAAPFCPVLAASGIAARAALHALQLSRDMARLCRADARRVHADQRRLSF